MCFDIVRKIRPPGELMRKDKVVEISGGKCAAADVSTAAAAIIKGWLIDGVKWPQFVDLTCLAVWIFNKTRNTQQNPTKWKYKNKTNKQHQKSKT